jgi:uncharacterized membrane protein YqjE
MFLSLASIVPDLLGFYSSTSFIFIFNGVRLFFFFFKFIYLGLLVVIALDDEYYLGLCS